MSWEAVVLWSDTHPGLASWAQALGTIIAVVAAIIIGKMPEKRHRKEEANKTEVMRLAILSIALSAKDSIVELQDEVAESSSVRSPFPDASLMVAEAHMITLNNVDLTRFPNVDMLIPFMQIKAEMEVGISACKTLKLSSVYGVPEFLAQTRLDAAKNNISSSFLMLKQTYSANEMPRGSGVSIKLNMIIDLCLAAFGMAIAFFAPLVVNKYFSMWKPLGESTGQWLERSAAISTVFSLIVIALMDECLGRIRQSQLSKSFETWARIIKGVAFVCSIFGTIIWGYGSVIF